MLKYKIVEKRVGETPLQALENFRKTEKSFAGLPMTYAGRLDPMASGKLLILIGEECKKRKKYDGLDKEYEVEILFGIKTDSGDVLGKILSTKPGFFTHTLEDVVTTAETFLGKRDVPYPKFSSRPVDGKPMFQHAILDNLENIEIPISKLHIKRIEVLGLRKISFGELKKDAINKINTLQLGDLDSRVGSGFRKNEILEDWNKLEIDDSQEFQLAKLNVVSASGGYMRTLAEMISEKLGGTGLAYSINRTKIGKYLKIINTYGFWTRVFK